MTMASFTPSTACWRSSAKIDPLRASSPRTPTQATKSVGLKGLVLFFASTARASWHDNAASQLTPMPAPRPTLHVENGLMMNMDTMTRRWEQGKWTALHPVEPELRKRAAVEPVAESTESIAITIPTATTPTAPTTAESSTQSPAETAAPSPLPTFFDGGLLNNFTDESCLNFINHMIAAPEFHECYPISLLLAGSTSFFKAQQSLVSISRVLDRACAANVTSCANYLATVATNLTRAANCAADYAAGNPTVVQAYLGLVAYPVVYSATCLKEDVSAAAATGSSSGNSSSSSTATSAYCYGAAVTNTTEASQTYFYFLPLNASLPGATMPFCGACLRDTMAIYHVATANRRQPIAGTYGAAACMVNVLCGTGFANATLADALVTSAARRGAAATVALAIVTAALVVAGGWLV